MSASADDGPGHHARFASPLLKSSFDVRMVTEMTIMAKNVKQAKNWWIQLGGQRTPGPHSLSSVGHHCFCSARPRQSAWMLLCLLRWSGSLKSCTMYLHLIWLRVNAVGAALLPAMLGEGVVV